MNFNYSSFFIRDLIYHKILDNTIHELLFSFDSKSFIPFPSTLSHRHKLINDPDFLYHYHLTNLLGLQIGKHFYTPIRYSNFRDGVYETSPSLSSNVHQDENYTYTVEVLMQNDLNKVNLFYACVAWLSIDEFRWHLLPEFSHIPEDLCYGLCSDYPDLILPYASFISKVNRQSNIELLDTPTIDIIKQAALNSSQ